MQRLLSLRQLLSRTSSTNCPNNSSSSKLLGSENLSSLSKTTENHLHHCNSPPNQPRHFFSSAPSQPWRSRHSSPEKIYRFLSSPILVNRILSNSKSLVCRVGAVRAELQRRSFHYNRAFESQRRGWRSWYRRLTTDGVVLGLILTNVGVFMLWRIADSNFMKTNFMISLDNVKSGRLHTMITSAFSHIDTMHLVSNMIGLYFFGMSIGRAFGPEYLLKLYLSGALAGSVFYLMYHAFLASSSKSQGMWGVDPSRIPGLGASGAVNAIMLLDIFLFPTKTLYLEFIIPVPAILLGIFLIGKDMLRILEGDTQISGSAHLGGAVAAAVAWARIRRGRF